MRVASTSISNCCLIFGNVSTSEGARTIFDFPVTLELVELLLVYEFPLHFILVECRIFVKLEILVSCLQNNSAKL